MFFTWINVQESSIRACIWLIDWYDMASLFYGISTSMGYLMPKQVDEP